MAKTYKPGSFFSISLSKEKLAYARLISDYLFSFYTVGSVYQTKQELVESLRYEAPIFSTHVFARVFNRSNWVYIAHEALDFHILNNMPVFFRQSAFDKTKCLLIKSDDPDFEAPLNPEDCINMEREMVWDPENIEERLRNYLDKIPNKTVELSKVQL